MKSKIGIIIGREFNERVKKKSFIITTLLTPVLMIALMFAPMLLSIYSEGETKKIAVVDDSRFIAGQLQSNSELLFETSPLPIDIARSEYRDHFAIVHIGEDIMENPTSVRIYTNDATAMSVEMNIAAQIESVLQNEKLKAYNIENLPQILTEINTNVTPQSFKNEPTAESESSSSSIAATVIAYILSFVLYMFLLI